MLHARKVLNFKIKLREYFNPSFTSMLWFLKLAKEPFKIFQTDGAYSRYLSKYFTASISHSIAQNFFSDLPRMLLPKAFVLSSLFWTSERESTAADVSVDVSVYGPHFPPSTVQAMISGLVREMPGNAIWQSWAHLNSLSTWSEKLMAGPIW